MLKEATYHYNSLLKGKARLRVGEGNRLANLIRRPRMLDDPFGRFGGDVVVGDGRIYLRCNAVERQNEY